MIGPYRGEVFNSFTCWRTGQTIAVSHGEQSVLAASADNYPLFDAALKTMQPVADRYVDGAAQADDPKPLGEEFGSLAYELRGPSARYVAHFFNRDVRADITKLRARNLALAALYKIPHLPRLISHSIAKNTVITTYPAGLPSSEIDAGAVDLGSYPSQFLSNMRKTAQAMSVAGLVLNVDWENPEESFGRPVAYYDPRDAGPTFLDVIARQESPPQRSVEPGRLYAELVTSAIATGTPITKEASQQWGPYPAAAIAARLRFLDTAHPLLRVQWRGSLGVEWLRRTAVQLVKAAPESQREPLKKQSTLAQLPPQH